MSDFTRTFLPADTFIEQLARRDVDFFTGVPDSVLKDFCSYIEDHIPVERHIMTGNEGQAVSVAAGYQMATNRTPLVYIQNSGFGNMVNPLMSLTHKNVYSIPMIIMMGWRGEPGRKDEPQHRVMGRANTAFCNVMDLAYEILPDDAESSEEVLDIAVEHCRTQKTPFIILVRKRTFETYKSKGLIQLDRPLIRENVLECVSQSAPNGSVFVGTTGFTSRELFEIREKHGQTHATDFYTVGCMGHATSIATGIAVARPNRKVYVFDGDGAALMNLSGFATIGIRGLQNLNHILVQNECHESTGQQPTGSGNIDFCQIAMACGYKSAHSVETLEEMQNHLNLINSDPFGPHFLEVKVKPGVRNDLGRPTQTPKQNKDQLMSFLRKV